MVPGKRQGVGWVRRVALVVAAAATALAGGGMPAEADDEPVRYRVEVQGTPYAGPSNEVAYNCNSNEGWGGTPVDESGFATLKVEAYGSSCNIFYQLYYADAGFVTLIRRVALVDGMLVQFGPMPADLSVRLVDQDGQAVVGAKVGLRQFSPSTWGGEEDFNAGLGYMTDGSPRSFPMDRTKRLYYTVTLSDGQRFERHIDPADLSGLTELVIEVPPVVDMTVSGSVQGWTAGDTGSAFVRCGSTDLPQVDLDTTGHFETSENRLYEPTCTASVSLQVQGVLYDIARDVHMSEPADGETAATGSAPFSLPGTPPATADLYAVDQLGAPVALTGSVQASDVMWTLPDGAQARGTIWVSVDFAQQPVTVPLWQANAAFGYTFADELQTWSESVAFETPDRVATFVASGWGSWVFGPPGTNSDGDGVSDVLESAAPNGDGNGDGVADAAQAGVTSLPSSTGGYVTLALGGGETFGPVRAVPAQDYGTPPAGYVLPEGLVGFEVRGVAPGGDATVRIYTSDVSGVTGYAKWQDGAWSVLPAERVVINADEGWLAVTVTDGGVGDDDGTADGTIVDPGGPVTVLDNQVPVVAADMGVSGLDSVGSKNTSITLSGSFVDPDGAGPYTASVQWADGGAWQPAVVTGDRFSASYSYPGNGTQVATVQVCDAAGGCGSDTVSITTGVKSKVRPVLQCVTDLGKGTSPRYVASFGYDSAASVPMWIPRSGRTQNAFLTGPADRGQPQVFWPGAHSEVFTTSFTHGAQIWILDRKLAAASKLSPRC